MSCIKADDDAVRILQRSLGADDVLNLSQFLAPDFGDDWLRIGGFNTAPTAASKARR